MVFVFRGTLQVKYFEEDKPSDEQLRTVEHHANVCIQRNWPVRVFDMNRVAAEAFYTNQPVNNSFIYDETVVPASEEMLNLVEIENWTVNCCRGLYLL